MAHNDNCDGSHCRFDVGEVRVYPLGGGGNLILCLACFAYENKFRYERHDSENFPQVAWATAKRYGKDDI